MAFCDRDVDKGRMAAHCEMAIFIHKHKSHSYIRIITIKPFLNYGHYYIITVCHPKRILHEKSAFLEGKSANCPEQIITVLQI